MVVCLLLGISVIGGALPLAAQVNTNGTMNGSTAFAIAMVDSRSPSQAQRFAGAEAIIERQTSGEWRDVIVVRDDVSPALISDAVRTLAGLRAIQGDVATSAGTYRVRKTGRSPQRPAEALDWIKLLKKTSPRRLNEESVSYIVVYMPNQHKK
jgi:hypothetical protein